MAKFDNLKDAKAFLAARPMGYQTPPPDWSPPEKQHRPLNDRPIDRAVDWAHDRIGGAGGNYKPGGFLLDMFAGATIDSLHNASSGGASRGMLRDKALPMVELAFIPGDIAAVAAPLVRKALRGPKYDARSPSKYAPVDAFGPPTRATHEARRTAHEAQLAAARPQDEGRRALLGRAADAAPAVLVGGAGASLLARRPAREFSEQGVERLATREVRDPGVRQLDVLAEGAGNSRRFSDVTTDGVFRSSGQWDRESAVFVDDLSNMDEARRIGAEIPAPRDRQLKHMLDTQYMSSYDAIRFNGDWEALMRDMSAEAPDSMRSSAVSQIETYWRRTLGHDAPEMYSPQWYERVQKDLKGDYPGLARTIERDHKIDRLTYQANPSASRERATLNAAKTDMLEKQSERIYATAEELDNFVSVKSILDEHNGQPSNIIDALEAHFGNVARHVDRDWDKIRVLEEEYPAKIAANNMRYREAVLKNEGHVRNPEVRAVEAERKALEKELQDAYYAGHDLKTGADGLFRGTDFKEMEEAIDFVVDSKRIALDSAPETLAPAARKRLEDELENAVQLRKAFQKYRGGKRMEFVPAAPKNSAGKDAAIGGAAGAAIAGGGYLATKMATPMGRREALRTVKDAGKIAVGGGLTGAGVNTARRFLD